MLRRTICDGFCRDSFRGAAVCVKNAAVCVKNYVHAYRALGKLRRHAGIEEHARKNIARASVAASGLYIFVKNTAKYIARAASAEKVCVFVEHAAIYSCVVAPRSVYRVVKRPAIDHNRVGTAARCYFPIKGAAINLAYIIRRERDFLLELRVAADGSVQCCRAVDHAFAGQIQRACFAHIYDQIPAKDGVPSHVDCDIAAGNRQRFLVQVNVVGQLDRSFALSKQALQFFRRTGCVRIVRQRDGRQQRERQREKQQGAEQSFSHHTESSLFDWLGSVWCTLACVPTV